MQPPQRRTAPAQHLHVHDATGLEWTQKQEGFMLEALKEAEEAMKQREVPVGCAPRMRTPVNLGTRHAEFQAIDQVIAHKTLAGQDTDFSRCVLYVTVEPCIMCAGALALLGIGQVGTTVMFNATSCGWWTK
eukprot:351557-Chlamydomonas_euryale.AAC.28